MSFTLRARRVLIGAVTGAMALSLLPAGAASAGIEEVCAGAEESAFTDKGTTHADNIDCLAAYEITTGQTATTFGTFSPLSRGQAATLFVNFALVATDGAIADEIDETVEVPFTDIAGTTHESNIEILYRLGLIEGTTETTYTPSANISRAQFATILYNAHVALGLVFDDTYAQAFADTIGSVHNDSINALAGEGIISGTTAVTYEPSANVTRGQTATLLMESAGVLDDAGLWDASLPGQTNQSITVTPSDEATLVISDEDERQFTATGLDDSTEYDLALVPSEDVTIEDGVVSLEDDDDNDEYEPNASANAEISVINGSSVSTDQTEASPVGGQIQFTVTGTGFAEVTPIIWVDAEDDGNVELAAGDDDHTPTEDFGVGGSTQFIPDEATIAVPGTVLFVDKDADYFVTANGRYDYDSGDVFQYNANGITLAQFETALSVDDVLAGTYSQDFQSTFNITTDEPGTPTGLTAADIGNIDGDDDAFDVEFEWNAPDPADGLIGNYQVAVFGADDDDDADACAGTQITGSPFAVGGTDTNLEVNDLENGDYCAQVRALSQDGATTAGDWSATETFNVQSGDVDDTAPTIEDATYDDADSSGVTMNVGDTITLDFDEDMAALAGDDTDVIRFTDADGATYQLRNTVNATFSLIAGDDTTDVLTIELTAAPTQVAGSDGDNPNAQLDATVTVLSDTITDEAGNEVDLAGSADIVIDNEL